MDKLDKAIKVANGMIEHMDQKELEQFVFDRLTDELVAEETDETLEQLLEDYDSDQEDPEVMSDAEFFEVKMGSFTSGQDKSFSPR